VRVRVEIWVREGEGRIRDSANMGLRSQTLLGEEETTLFSSLPLTTSNIHSHSTHTTLPLSFSLSHIQTGTLSLSPSLPLPILLSLSLSSHSHPLTVWIFPAPGLSHQLHSLQHTQTGEKKREEK
jgi:hypothetical protein